MKLGRSPLRGLLQEPAIFNQCLLTYCNMLDMSAQKTVDDLHRLELLFNFFEVVPKIKLFYGVICACACARVSVHLGFIGSR